MNHRDELELRYDGPIPPNALCEMACAAPIGLDRMDLSMLENERVGALVCARDRWKMAATYNRSANIADAAGHATTAARYRADAAESLDRAASLVRYAQTVAARMTDLMNAASAERAAG